ncbi:MAG: hypothetical protein IJ717_00900 [Treponema sp.]|nr:hypothetical protein [Treponema sp.]
MRIISDKLYARLIKELLKNESVATFRELLLSEKSDKKGGENPTEKEIDELEES